MRLRGSRRPAAKKSEMQGLYQTVGVGHGGRRDETICTLQYLLDTYAPDFPKVMFTGMDMRTAEGTHPAFVEFTRPVVPGPIPQFDTESARLFLHMYIASPISMPHGVLGAVATEYLGGPSPRSQVLRVHAIFSPLHMPMEKCYVTTDVDFNFLYGEVYHGLKGKVLRGHSEGETEGRAFFLPPDASYEQLCTCALANIRYGMQMIDTSELSGRRAAKRVTHAARGAGQVEDVVRITGLGPPQERRKGNRWSEMGLVESMWTLGITRSTGKASCYSQNAMATATLSNPGLFSSAQNDYYLTKVVVLPLDEPMARTTVPGTDSTWAAMCLQEEEANRLVTKTIAHLDATGALYAQAGVLRCAEVDLVLTYNQGHVYVRKVDSTFTTRVCCWDLQRTTFRGGSCHVVYVYTADVFPWL